MTKATANNINTPNIITAIKPSNVSMSITPPFYTDK